jgi:hypothetical protein
MSFLPGTGWPWSSGVSLRVTSRPQRLQPQQRTCPLVHLRANIPWVGIRTLWYLFVPANQRTQIPGKEGWYVRWNLPGSLHLFLRGRGTQKDTSVMFECIMERPQISHVFKGHTPVPRSHV